MGDVLKVVVLSVLVVRGFRTSVIFWGKPVGVVRVMYLRRG